MNSNEKFYNQKIHELKSFENYIYNRATRIAKINGQLQKDNYRDTWEEYKIEYQTKKNKPEEVCLIKVYFKDRSKDNHYFSQVLTLEQLSMNEGDWFDFCEQYSKRFLAKESK